MKLRKRIRSGSQRSKPLNISVEKTKDNDHNDDFDDYWFKNIVFHEIEDLQTNMQTVLAVKNKEVMQCKVEELILKGKIKDLEETIEVLRVDKEDFKNQMDKKIELKNSTVKDRLVIEASKKQTKLIIKLKSKLKRRKEKLSATLDLNADKDKTIEGKNKNIEDLCSIVKQCEVNLNDVRQEKDKLKKRIEGDSHEELNETKLKMIMLKTKIGEKDCDLRSMSARNKEILETNKELNRRIQSLLELQEENEELKKKLEDDKEDELSKVKVNMFEARIKEKENDMKNMSARNKYIMGLNEELKEKIKCLQKELEVLKEAAFERSESSEKEKQSEYLNLDIQAKDFELQAKDFEIESLKDSNKRVCNLMNLEMDSLKDFSSKISKENEELRVNLQKHVEENISSHNTIFKLEESLKKKEEEVVKIQLQNGINNSMSSLIEDNLSTRSLIIKLKETVKKQEKQLQHLKMSDIRPRRSFHNSRRSKINSINGVVPNHLQQQTSSESVNKLCNVNTGITLMTVIDDD